MSDTKKGDFALEPPASMIELAMKFVQEGLVTLLLPPVPLVREWMQHDQVLSQEQKEQLSDFLFQMEDNRGQSLSSGPTTNEDIQQLDQLRLHTVQFTGQLTNKFFGYIMESVFPLFYDGQFNIDPEMSVIPPKRFSDLESTIDESLYDLVLWVATQVDSPEASQVIAQLKGMSCWDEREVLVDQMMDRFDYKHLRIRLVKDRILVIFRCLLDGVIIDLATTMKNQVMNALVGLMEQDRAAIPGPAFLE